MVTNEGLQQVHTVSADTSNFVQFCEAVDKYENIYTDITLPGQTCIIFIVLIDLLVILVMQHLKLI